MAKIKPTESKKKPKAPEWLFANITEASKNARKIYFLYIGFLFYCAFTVFGTPDRYIILNEKIKMPILNIDVPLIGFMLMAPLVAIFLFVYLQMYLGRLKWLIDLSTDYAPIEKGRLYPWMLNFPKDPESGFSKGLQTIIIKFSLWWLLPLVLGLFAALSLRTHNSLICYIDGIATIFGTTCVLVFWFRYDGVQRKILKFTTKNLGKVLLPLIMFLFGFMFLFDWIPMSLSGRLFVLNLSNEKLTTKPTEDHEGIYWGHFRGVHLEGALLFSTILKRADLRDAHLQYANMIKVNLEEADLSEANLFRAILMEANLSKANLFQAYLKGADLRDANFFKANLFGAKLNGAELWGADFSFANLQGANFSGVSNLSVTSLKKARLWLLAIYDEDLLTTLGLPADHKKRTYRNDFSKYNFKGADLNGAYLSGADLREAGLREAGLSRADLSFTNLSGADLKEADLKEADFFKANLRGADLRGADLQDAVYLTIEQLSEVKSLYQAKLDPELEKEIKEKYPHLLEKSSWLKEEEEEKK